ncbi:MAG: hypothetical protein AAFP20_20020 [Cyanobacteria bacterium J06614_10]
MKDSYHSSYHSLCDQFEGERSTYLKEHLTMHHGWPEEQASQAVRQYVMFLYIASLNLHRPLVPTQQIDRVWEADILRDTAQYIRTCRQLCGEVIHHAGSSRLQPVSDSSKQAIAFADTQRLFAQHFGENSLDGRAAMAAACGVLIDTV